MNDHAPDAAEPLAIEAMALTHRFRTQLALNNVTLTVAARSIHGFVGPNGAGKTTTLKIAATLLPPQAGRMRLFGLDVVRDRRAVRRRIGFMPDHFSMYRQMTVQEYLDFFGAAYGLDHARRRAVMDDVLALTDMEGRRHSLIRSLSRGMQQRVSLARVLVNDPDLLLLDEPASGLDPRARIELMEILRELRHMGKTIFISSHILSELATLCDSVTIIDRGTIRYSGSMAGLLAHDGDRAAYVLALAEPAPELSDRLGKLAGVTAVSDAEDGRALHVRFDRTRVDTGAILRAALDGGARVVGFKADEKQLNQAFLDLTEPGVPA